jgi:putative Mg2+ transporter-C (MgtC) family protein
MDIFGVDIDWYRVLSHLYHLAAAYLLALPIGWDREQSKRSFGLRTFPLVAMASCGFMLVGALVIDSTGGEARVLQGIITGIGFIGGGAILKDHDRVAGTATAASIWITGAVGLAVAYDRYEIALVLAALTFLTLRLFGEIKEKMDTESEARE